MASRTNKDHPRRGNTGELLAKLGGSTTSIGSIDNASIGSIDTVSSKGRAYAGRTRLRRAASVRKIGRTPSSSSFLQHKRVKYQRRVLKTLQNSDKNDSGGDNGDRPPLSRSVSDRPTRSNSEMPQRGTMERSLSSDDVLNYDYNEDDSSSSSLQESLRQQERARSSTSKTAKPSGGDGDGETKATLSGKSSSLMDAATRNYEKALAKVSLLFTSTDESEITKKPPKKSVKSKPRAVLGGTGTTSSSKSRHTALSSNYDEALAKAVQRFTVQ